MSDTVKCGKDTGRCLYQTESGNCLRPQQMRPVTDQGDYGGRIVGDKMMTCWGLRPWHLVDLNCCRYQNNGHRRTPVRRAGPVTVIRRGVGQYCRELSPGHPWRRRAARGRAKIRLNGKAAKVGLKYTRENRGK